MRIIIDYNEAIRRCSISSYGFFRAGSSDFDCRIPNVSRDSFILLSKSLKKSFSAFFNARLVQDVMEFCLPPPKENKDEKNKNKRVSFQEAFPQGSNSDCSR